MADPLVPQVTDMVMNIVGNLRATIPALKDVAPWRIDWAHREWSTSEGYPDESDFLEWLPDDTMDNRFRYLREMRIGDLNRSIAEQGNTILQYIKENRDLRQEVADLKAELKANTRTLQME